MPIPNNANLEFARGLFVDANVKKVALYSVVLDATKTAYDTTNELPTAGGYIQGGYTLAVGALTPNFWGTGTVKAICDFANTTSGATDTFTFRSILIYDDTHASKKAMYYFPAASDVPVSSGQLTIIWPTADDTNAIIRLAG